MKTKTRKLLLLISYLMACTLVACVSVNQPKQNLVIYDFGLSVSSEKNQTTTSKILLENPVAADALNHRKIRYRLNYQNPLRVFFYSESRWAAVPSVLLSSKINQMVNYAQRPTNCSLRLKIEAFDHVFQSVDDSEGVAQLSALLIEKNTKKIISSQLITVKTSASSPDAEGGVAAIQYASEAALEKAIQWGNLVQGKSELCD